MWLNILDLFPLGRSGLHQTCDVGVQKLRGKIIRTILWCVVYIYESCVQWYTHN